jgi:histidinol-phosphate phosphatase family protein
MILKKIKIDFSWTLFLDRDGVINKKIVDDYVIDWDQFEFLPGVHEAFKTFAQIFGKIIVVTNQQGIGKGLMTESKLKTIHSNMIAEINKQGGRIDAIYFAPSVKEANHIDRKPNVGMALKAKKDFPEIDFKRSIIAGDSKSDMEFGHRLGMIKAFINSDATFVKNNPALIDITAISLFEFSKLLTKLK